MSDDRALTWSEHVLSDGRDGELKLVDLVIDENAQRRHGILHHAQREGVHVADPLARRHRAGRRAQHVVQLLRRLELVKHEARLHHRVRHELAVLDHAAAAVPPQDLPQLPLLRPLQHLRRRRRVCH